MTKQQVEETPGWMSKPAPSAQFMKEMIEGYSKQDAAKPLATGVKHDQGKEPLGLLARSWLLGVARVLAFGAKKYAAHNWRGGIERSRLIDASLRHILAYNEGEDLDPESGLNHLYHASCCLMFASELHITRPDLDDRYKAVEK